MAERWLLCCRVVDNYGDIGVAWRLARQLSADNTRRVVLCVDGLASFQKLEPRIDPRAARQTVEGIDIAAWSDELADPADVVIELFGCGLPPPLMRSLEDLSAVWIELEYLSAEAWVADFHGLPSPHPSSGVVRHYFYPGFDQRTGGLLVEPDLEARRLAFLGDPDAVAAFWTSLGLPPSSPDEKRLLVFGYPQAPIATLLSALALDAACRWSAIVPEGIAAGGPAVRRVPFVTQDRFDQLLWACDAAFVRGEDSFVRAQLAGRPFVWQIYPQPEDAHRPKLAAFADRYEAALSAPARAAQRALWHAWNGLDGDLADAWPAWTSHLPELTAHAGAWRRDLLSRSSLVDRLIAFVAAQRAALLK